MKKVYKLKAINFLSRCSRNIYDIDPRVRLLEQSIRVTNLFHGLWLSIGLVENVFMFLTRLIIIVILIGFFQQSIQICKMKPSLEFSLI